MGEVMEKTNVCLKLLVDSKANKVLFAECGKDFIDFLFNILTLPIGYLFGQSSTKSVFGSLSNMIPILNMQLNDLDDVQEIKKWVIADNLFIEPSSATSAISLLKRVNAQVDSLEHMTIDFQISDLEQEFLHVSLMSKTVLTDVFLRQTEWRKSNNGEKCSLTLIVDSKTNSVVFVEAGRDFFGFLISLLHLPIATVINRTNNDKRPRTMIGCIGNIYQSVKNFNVAYMQSNQTKDELLIPVASNSWFDSMQLFQATPNKVLDCDGGYVKGLVCYMITDDLSVSPLSLISGLSTFKMCGNAESIAKFDVKTVRFGINETLRFFEASFRSETVLSDVFLVRDELAVV